MCRTRRRQLEKQTLILFDEFVEDNRWPDCAAAVLHAR